MVIIPISLAYQDLWDLTPYSVTSYISLKSINIKKSVFSFKLNKNVNIIYFTKYYNLFFILLELFLRSLSLSKSTNIVIFKV